MEQRHRNALRRNLSVIVDDIKPIALLIHLPILTSSSKQAIEAQNNQHGARRAASTLVDEIQRKGPRAFQCFLEALWQERQYHVIDVILDTLPQVEGMRFRALLNENNPYDHYTPPTAPPPYQQSTMVEQRPSTAVPYGRNPVQAFQAPARPTTARCNNNLDACSLNELPFGTTRKLIPGLNKLGRPEVETLMDACSLTYGESRKVTDGESLFGVLADKGLLYGELINILKNQGYYDRVHGLVESQPQTNNPTPDILTGVQQGQGGNNYGVSNRGPVAPVDHNSPATMNHTMEAQKLRTHITELEVEDLDVPQNQVVVDDVAKGVKNMDINVEQDHCGRGDPIQGGVQRPNEVSLRRVREKREHFPE